MTARVSRVNQANRPAIMQYIGESFDRISETKGGRISIIDIWDTEFEVEKRFGVSDYQSQKLTWDVIDGRRKETK
jgi:hypothetical protein